MIGSGRTVFRPA